MDHEQICKFLGDVILFSDLDEDQRQEVVCDVEVEHYHCGDILSLKNANHGLYVVVSGQLAAIQDKLEHNEQTEIIKYKTGHMFLIPGARGNHIQALESAVVLVFKQSVLNRIAIPFLRSLNFFGDLSEEELKAIAREVSLESYAPGEILFSQGAPTDSLYFVLTGEVAMLLKEDAEDGEPVVEEIATYTRGTSFGERGVLSNQPRAATAMIEESTSFLVLTRERFHKLVAEYDKLAFGFYQNLADQLEEETASARRAARDVEKMKEVMQSTKMAALGQLVAGVAHEINTPVGAISADSHQLKRYLARVKEYSDNLPQVVKSFYEDDHLQAVADDLGYALDDQTRQLVENYMNRQLDSIQAYNKRQRIEKLFTYLMEITEEMDEASDRIKGIVRSLANFARLDEAELKSVDLHEGLDSTLALLHHELKYQVRVERDYGNLPEILCYPNQLNQVFMNILINAIQALELSGLKSGEKGNIRVKTYIEDAWAVIAITDNGKGIAPEHLEKIFDLYFSTKKPGAAAEGLGLGLGLPISQKIIQEKHFGKIEVESVLGHETTFFIKLPLHSPINLSSMV